MILIFVACVCVAFPDNTKVAGQDPCDSTPCLNGATCMMSYVPPPPYQCTCTSGYTGDNCETVISYTDSSRESNQKALTDGEIAGIVIGCVLLIVIIAVITVICIYKQKKTKANTASSDNTELQ